MLRLTNISKTFNPSTEDAKLALDNVSLHVRPGDFISIIGAIFALDPESSVFQIVSFAWAGFGASFGPVVLAALFWKGWGALAGMLGGGVMVFVWKFAIKPLGGVFNIYELLPAFVFALILMVVVSLITPAPDQEIMDEFDKVRADTAAIK